MTMLLLASAAVVHAQSPAIDIRILDAHGDVVPAIEVEGIYPTATAEHLVFLTVGASGGVGPSNVDVEIRDLRDYENGCSRPEVRAGDTTCGPGPDQGELSGQLEMTWQRGVADSDDTCAVDETLLSGSTLRDLEGVRIGIGQVGTDERICLALTQHFRADPRNNLAQGDSSVFDLRVHAEQVLGDARDAPDTSPEVVPPEDVDGGSVPEGKDDESADGRQETVLSERHDRTARTSPDSVPDTRGLPRTGFDLSVLVAVAALALLAGLRVLRRPRKPPG
ncbi:hypothetical protein [Egicoccus sp. AB-alg2]|uniref:hypothetical protein n=1 Tax=Egicoccus sp. AB-alg2 TaxID=3242693 RepID=UPI00359D1AD8